MKIKNTDVNEDAALDDAVNALGMNHDPELLHDDDADQESVEDDGALVSDSDADADDSAVADDLVDEDLDEDADAEEDSDAEEDGDEPDEDAEEDDDADADPKANRRNPKVEKRIAKEVAKRKAAEAVAKQHEAELKVLQEQLAEGKAKGRFDSVQSLADVAKARRELRRELDLIEEGIEEGELELEGKTFDAATLRRWRRQVRDELEDALPAVERRISRREEVNREQVARIYPELLDEGSDLRKQADKVLSRVPGLLHDPEALLLVGDLLRGRRLRMSAKSKSAAPKRVQAKAAPKDSGKGAGTRRVVRAPQGRSEDGEFIAKMERLARERQMV